MTSILKQGIGQNKLNPDDLRNKIEKILYKVTKPSRYIGQESGSANKDWASAEVKTVLAFPDLYEIGISNLGLRILYNKINNYSNANFLADRVYAPETDFKELLDENKIPLYAVESFRPLKEFDLIAYSLQYELSYPTILSMLEMACIPYKSTERSEFDPIIIAGGPGSYNPEPLSEFIDAFILGDGETVIIEILEAIKSLKNSGSSRFEILKKLSLTRGIYIPAFYETGSESLNPFPKYDFASPKIYKRIEEIDNKDFPVDFPVPYSTSVHDRAVVEIRRGCGRMCRFCQPCFINFPVRERSEENICELVNSALQNTGYEEYSLLSLSSNDYRNIENLVRKLNNEHAKNGVSISLPSQRADKFSLELAKLVQAVRKSTITLAPEAGTQRLRNAINKNLSEDEILNAVTSVYKAGWHAVKLYFMIGLPTETIEDIEGIYELLKTIKNNLTKIKNEFNISKPLSITCSISTFVPKPFTPFQWFGQDKNENLIQKINYLKEKTKFLKGVKLNFHDIFLCKLEAVFSRGNRKLNSLIEEAYKKGSYLDAWREHFNKQIWIDAANASEINLEEYSTRTFDLQEELPWDFLNVGVQKQWLIQEYNFALNSESSVPCENKCSNCGVCSEFNVKPSIKSQFMENDPLIQANPQKTKIFSEQGYKYRLKFSKTGSLRFISHLDWQKLIYTMLRKSGLKINFSQGFNPSPKIAIGLALPLFVEGENEIIDIELQEETAENIIKEKLNNLLPDSSKIIKIVKISKHEKSIERKTCWALYKAFPENNRTLKNFNLQSIAKDLMFKDNIILERLTKKGIKKINIRPYIHSLNFNETDNSLEMILKAGEGLANHNSLIQDKNNLNSGFVYQENENNVQRDSNVNQGFIYPENLNSVFTEQKVFVGSVRADEILKIIDPNAVWRIKRVNLLDCDFKELIS